MTDWAAHYPDTAAWLRATDWRHELEPFAEAWWAMFDTIQKADADTLDAIIAAAEQVGDSNCWFATYHAAPIAAELARDEQRRRAYQIDRDLRLLTETGRA